MSVDLVDPTADYCKQMGVVYECWLKKTLDRMYVLYLGRGFCKADAIWLAVADTQMIFSIDLGVNFDGPMA